MKQDWIVTTYDSVGRITGQFPIENRTEHEARSEAESDPEVRKAHDWSLMPKGWK